MQSESGNRRNKYARARRVPIAWLPRARAKKRVRLRTEAEVQVLEKAQEGEVQELKRRARVQELKRRAQARKLKRRARAQQLEEARARAQELEKAQARALKLELKKTQARALQELERAKQAEEPEKAQKLALELKEEQARELSLRTEEAQANVRAWARRWEQWEWTEEVRANVALFSVERQIKERAGALACTLASAGSVPGWKLEEARQQAKLAKAQRQLAEAQRQAELDEAPRQLLDEELEALVRLTEAQGQVEKAEMAEALQQENLAKVLQELTYAQNAAKLVKARQQAVARAQALAVALAALTLNERETPSLPQEVQSLPYEPTYAELSADLKTKRIIDSIKPRYRYRLARRLWHHSEHWWLIQIIAPVTCLPPELLQSIFSIIIDDVSGPPLALMLVCQRWYASVTSIWTSLKLGTSTPRSVVTRLLESNQLPLNISLDTETDRGDFIPSEAAYEAIFAAIEATSRWRSLVVETTPGQADLPGHLVHRGLQRCSNATMSRLKTFKVKSACESPEMSPLLDRLLRILATTVSPEFTTVEINSPNVISLLPTYSPILRSVKVLVLDISGTHDPADLLPHLHQLEELTASYLSLPPYTHDINLPFVNTLRHLRLRAVSIQWMSGRTFDVLESCTIRFPLHPHIFSAILPNCKDLTFQGYPLHILDVVSAPKIIHLSVTSSGSFSRRGTQQLDWFSSRVLGESRLALRILHIRIEATSQALVNALAFVPHLEELVIENTHPALLRAKGLRSLVAQPVHASTTGVRSTPARWRAPACPSLRRFGLKYRRWLRPSEHFDLIPDIVSIISSREHSKCSLQSFWVWMGSDQRDPLELIEQSCISPKRIVHLANSSGFNEQDMWVSVNMRLTEAILRPPWGPFNVLS